MSEQVKSPLTRLEVYRQRDLHRARGTIERFQKTPLGRYFLPHREIQKSFDVYKDLKRLILNNQSPERIENMLVQEPDRVTMMVFPERLILARSQDMTVATVPVVKCTLKAMDEILQQQPRPEPFVTSGYFADTVEQIWENGENKNKISFVDYPSQSYNLPPQDYLALAGWYGLENEPLRLIVK